MADNISDANNTTYGSYVIAQNSGIKQDVESAIQDLITAAGEQLSASFDLDDYLTDFSMPDWNLLSPPSIPEADDVPAGYDTVQVPSFTFNPEDYINADLLQRYSYDSDFFDNFLESRLKTYIDSQGYFLAVTVQDALFTEMYNRDLQTLNDALDAVDRVQARRGFPLPSSMHLAARNDVIKKYQDTRNDRNKEVTALIADKSLQEKMHAMDTSIKMEDIRSRFQLEYGKLYWQAADYLIRKFESDVRAEIARVEANYRIIELNTRIDTRNSELTFSKTELENDKEKARLAGEVEELREQISLWKETYQARIQATREIVQYYQSWALGINGSYNAIDYNDKTS